MRVSVNVTNYSWTSTDLPEALDSVARAADDGGIDTLWVNDHLLQAEPGTTVDEPMLEAYAVLGYLASQTQRVRLGTMVTGVTFRPPALLIKAITSIDVLSRGRAWLGVGAGYHSAEADAMGLPLPDRRTRFEVLSDTLALARQMWAGERGAFQGAAVAMDDPVGSPLPTTKPHPPILIGGMGEQRTLPLWPGSPMPAICSTSRTAAGPSRASWRSSPICARRRAGRSRRSTRPSVRASTRRSLSMRLCSTAATYRRSASTTWCASPPARGPRRRSSGWLTSPRDWAGAD